MWFIGVEAEQETSAPPPKKNPGSAPGKCLYWQGVCIKQVMLIKSKRNLLLQQNSKEIKQDISIINLNVSNHHKAVLPWTYSTETLKNHSFLYYLIKSILCMTRFTP